MFLLAKAMLLFFLNFSFAAAGSSLTGIAPGADPMVVKNKAGDDPSYVNNKAFEKAMVETHNKWRREHGAKDVSWDPKLADYAEKVAKKCEWRHSVCDTLAFKL